MRIQIMILGFKGLSLRKRRFLIQLYCWQVSLEMAKPQLAAEYYTQEEMVTDTVVLQYYYSYW